MQYFNILALEGLQFPNRLLEWTLNFLKTYAEDPKVIFVPKNFTGKKVGAQALNVPASSITEFDLLANGARDFPNSEHMVVTHIRALSGVNATLSLTQWVAGIIDAGLLNSTWRLDINGMTLYDDMPMDMFTQSVEQNDSGYFSLPSPVAWFGQSKAEIIVKTGAGVVASTNVKFELSGPGFTS